LRGAIRPTSQVKRLPDFECHSPIMNLIENVEIIGRLEQEMFEKILQNRCGAKRRALEPHEAAFTSQFEASADRVSESDAGSSSFTVSGFQLIDDDASHPPTPSSRICNL
jgi:hypothetical protein